MCEVVSVSTGYASGDVGGTVTATVAAPADPAERDMLYAYIRSVGEDARHIARSVDWDDITGKGTRTMVHVGDRLYTDWEDFQTLLAREATADEPSLYTFAISSDTYTTRYTPRVSVTIVRVRHNYQLDPADAIEAHAWGDAHKIGRVVTGSVAPEDPGLLLAFGARDSGSTQADPPAGFTEQVDAVLGVDHHMVASLAWPDGGATGARYFVTTPPFTPTSGLLGALRFGVYSEVAAEVAPVAATMLVAGAAGEVYPGVPALLAPGAASMQVVGTAVSVEAGHVPTRPVALDNDVRLVDAAGALVGVFAAAVSWSQRLDGADTIDVTLPKRYLSKEGASRSRLAALLTGWRVYWIGRWFGFASVGKLSGDTVTLRCRSIEEQELGANYEASIAGIVMAGTPSEIMAAVLEGHAGSRIPYGHFADVGEEGDDGTAYARGWLQGYTIASLGYVRTGRDRGVWALAVDGDRHVLASLRLDSGWSSPVVYPASMVQTPTGSSWQLSLDARADEELAAPAGLYAELVWYAGDQQTVLARDVYELAVTEDWQRFVFPAEGTYAAARGDYLLPRIRYEMVPTNGLGATVCYLDDVRLLPLGLDRPTGWHYQGSMDTRDPHVTHDDGEWVEDGAWTVVGAAIQSSVVGDKLSRIFTGDRVVVGFAGGAAGVATITVDGETVVSGLDVSAETAYPVTDLGTDVSHILTIHVVSGTVAVTGLELSTERILWVEWYDRSARDCLQAVVDECGGEIYVDSGSRTIFHDLTQGIDLRAANILELRRGAHLLDYPVTREFTNIRNRYICLGYGEGAHRLRVIVNARSTNAAGQTSQELYGVLTDTFEAADIEDAVTLERLGQEAIEGVCFPSVSRSPVVTDEAASYMAPGDTVRVYWDEDPDDVTDESVRVLEIHRTNDGAPATLTVGALPRTLGRELAKGGGR
jgi:hypothetical protein